MAATEGEDMDVGNIAELNTFLVLDAIRSSRQATRAELSRELGLSDASVSRIVKRLLARGIIEERPGEATVRGRTPAVLHFVGPVGGVIAVDLGGTKCHGALADLAGETVTEDISSIGSGGDAAETLLQCIATLRRKSRAIDMPVRAVVVGIPALIDPKSGLATAGPNVHWEGFDLMRVLASNLKEPFEVDNDVNLAALGQAWRGQGRGVESFVTVSLGTGIGGAVVVGGRLVRGRHNAAGEVGYFLMSPSQLRSSAGQPGFEQVASGPALKARAAAILAEGHPSVLDPRRLEVADVFAAAASGDATGQQVVRELLDHLAVMVVGITALVDPERIILDGSIARAFEPWLGELRELVESKVFSPPDIVMSKLGPNATVIGAMARALAIVSQSDAPAPISKRVVVVPDHPRSPASETALGEADGAVEVTVERA